ncbi:MAG: hypothetical protein IJ367_04640, partial [Clostridia bacterium]|nr:hypothetical protein [Clostridia bacterium]
TDGEDSLANHAVWGPQMNLNNLKVVVEESQYTDFALDTASATASVNFKKGNSHDEVVSLIIAEYDAETGKLLQVNIEYIDTSLLEVGASDNYSVSLTGVTGNLKAMLMDENLVPYFNVAE